MIFKDIAKKENLYTIANALEDDNSTPCNRVEEKVLKKLLNDLDVIDHTEILKNDIIDLLAMARLKSYVKGMKMGARLYALLNESNLESEL